VSKSRVTKCERNLQKQQQKNAPSPPCQLFPYCTDFHDKCRLARYIKGGSKKPDFTIPWLGGQNEVAVKTEDIAVLEKRYAREHVQGISSRM